MQLRGEGTWVQSSRAYAGLHLSDGRNGPGLNTQRLGLGGHVGIAVCGLRVVGSEASAGSAGHLF